MFDANMHDYCAFDCGGWLGAVVSAVVVGCRGDLRRAPLNGHGFAALDERAQVAGRGRTFIAGAGRKFAKGALKSAASCCSPGQCLGAEPGKFHTGQLAAVPGQIVHDGRIRG